ncbi:MAG: hypothetical protein AAF657_28535 [Acidobacteriota bacterium]
MKKTVLIALTSFLCLSTLALASGSSGGGGSIPSGGTSVDPYNVTQMMKCVVTEIRPDGTVIVRDNKAETVHPLAVNSKTKFSAQSKKEFNGRKQIELSDLKVGHELKVVKRQVNGEVLRVKVLKKA